jgi:general secretion pathway protein A
MKPILEVVPASQAQPAPLSSSATNTSDVATATVAAEVPQTPAQREGAPAFMPELPPAIRQAHHALGMSRNPFPPTPDAQGYFFTEQLSSDFAETLHCIRSRKGFVLITGEVGLGKSTFVRNVIDTVVQENTAVSLVLNTFLQGGALLAAINDDFGLPREHSNGDAAALDGNLAVQLTRLNAFLLSCASVGKNCLLIIDDAQNLNRQSLELVRLLCNVETGQEKLLQIVLVGQPELLDTLNEPSLRQLKSRIVKHVQLLGLTMSDTSRYIDYRMIQAGLGAEVDAGGSQQIHLRPEAVTTLFSATLGNPRRLNLVMDRCLYGLVANRSRVVTQELVRAGVAETTVTVGAKSGQADAGTAQGFLLSLQNMFKNYVVQYASAWAALAIAVPALLLAGWSVWRDSGSVGGGVGSSAKPALASSSSQPVLVAPTLPVATRPATEVAPLPAVVATPQIAPTTAPALAVATVNPTPSASSADARLTECAARLSKNTAGTSLQQMHLQPIPISAVAQYGKALEQRNLVCVLNVADAPLLMWQKTAFSEQVRGAQPNAALQDLQRNLQQRKLLMDGRVDGWLGPRTQDALKQFQAKYNLPVTGEPDALTTLLLENFHG